MNLRQLEYFVAVAEHGSFSKAAVVLNVAQPALSRQVRLLETDLRITLLTRNGRGVAVTEAGKRLFEQSVTILQLMSEVRDGVTATRDEPAGRVTIGLPPSFGRMLTLPLVQRFRHSLPKAQLSVVEGLSAHLTEWIATGRVDIGLLFNPEPHAALEVMPILDEAICLVAPIAVSRPREVVPFADLARYPLVLPERSHTIRRLLDTHAVRAGIKLNVALEISSIQSILDLVSAGHGYAVLPRRAVGASVAPAQLSSSPIVEPRLISTLCMATSASKHPTPLVCEAQHIVRELIQ
ncbi:MAG: LysR substrate-binding domain-containing protein [Rhodocyclaceae bacterium]